MNNMGEYALNVSKYNSLEEKGVFSSLQIFKYVLNKYVSSFGNCLGACSKEGDKIEKMIRAIEEVEECWKNLSSLKDIKEIKEDDDNSSSAAR